MTLRVLITGRGTSGSWQIRGVQIGRAIGATVEANANAATIAAHDVVVVVKRAPDDLVQRIHASGRPLVWDVVDGWPQPGGNDWPRPACLSWLALRLRALRPIGCIAASRGMAADIEELGYPALPVWHHARPGQPVNPIREHVGLVGYEGSEAHLGTWRGHVEAACRQLGLRFVLQPQHLADVDVVVALRAATGYAARHWKSNVKLANAQGSGTPAIIGPERAYFDTDRGDNADAIASPQALLVALRDLAPRGVRAMRSVSMRQDAPTLQACAAEHLEFITALVAWR